MQLLKTYDWSAGPSGCPKILYNRMVRVVDIDVGMLLTWGSEREFKAEGPIPYLDANSPKNS